MSASIGLGQMLANDSLKSLNSLKYDLEQRMRRTAALKEKKDGGAKATPAKKTPTPAKKTPTKKSTKS